MAATTLKVSEYRDLIDALRQALVSLQSAVGPDEHRREAEWVRKAYRELAGAECKRATAHDRGRASSWLALAALALQKIDEQNSREGTP